MFGSLNEKEYTPPVKEVATVLGVSERNLKEKNSFIYFNIHVCHDLNK